MSQQNLALYVNDHLAGSVGAVKLFDRIRRVSDDDGLVDRVQEVQEAVRKDQQVLDDVRRRLGIRRSRVRNLAASLAQKLSSVKFRLEASKQGEVQLLHALDSLSLGIEGKKALWSALEVGAEVNPRLRGLVDHDALIQRADDQLATLRDLRSEVARRAFSPGEG
ncbi:MAG TPA: hypothetical protein VMT85_24815 [Thermoanaerobaculia bacterium]|nr:hypothetical protein [Thermoanaerobaculia bacterium]